MAERVDCLVVGAGVIGLASARALARAGREVVILERGHAFGSETSSRNSEVIHAGIYYPPGSLKARLCVAGKRALYDYAAAHGVEHRRSGKLIVASSARELPQLAEIKARAETNGVADLVPLTAADIRRLEPEVEAVAGLFSPSTGIIDSHGLMLSLLGEAEESGAFLAYDAPLLSGVLGEKGHLLQIGGRQPMELLARTVVNAAGLEASAVAERLSGLPPEHRPPTWFCKGNYYRLAGRTPFRHLVYPVPESAGLGVHVTLDLGGQARFGPDVEWVERSDDYDVDPRRAESFYAAVRRYWPGLPDGALLPAYAGIRPKLHPPGEAARDFLIEGPESHGVPGLVNLFGIESPGLTAALSIGELVRSLLGRAQALP